MYACTEHDALARLERLGDMGEIWGRYGGDMGEISGRVGVRFTFGVGVGVRAGARVRVRVLGLGF